MKDNVYLAVKPKRVASVSVCAASLTGSKLRAIMPGPGSRGGSRSLALEQQAAIMQLLSCSSLSVAGLQVPVQKLLHAHDAQCKCEWLKYQSTVCPITGRLLSGGVHRERRPDPDGLFQGQLGGGPGHQAGLGGY